MIDSVRIPQLSDDENRTVNGLLEQLGKTAPRNLLRSSFYDGRRAVKEIGSTIPPQYANIAIALGWAAKGVDGLARRCNLDRFVWADGDLDALGVRELEDSNFLMSELDQGETDSLIHGVSYSITTQGIGDEPRSLVHVRDALSATGEWNKRRRALDNLISVTGRDESGITAFNLYLNNLTIAASREGSKWTVDKSEHTWGVPAEPFVYRPRTSRPMGRSRITRPVMSIQEAALRALIRLEAHMDIYAIPKMILLGADESIFKNPDGSLKASWQIAMGRAFGIPDDDEATTPRASVEQFNAESPEPHLAQLNALAKLMARETDLPDADFALTDMANPTSAESYTASRENLIAESEGAMQDWSVPIRRTVMRALAIQNGEKKVPESWSSIDVKWRSPIYLSRAAEADAGAKQLAVVPWLAETRVGLELLGLSDQQIDLALAERKQNAGRQAAVSLIAARQAEVLNGDSGGVQGPTSPAG
ncbi:hypothetical protein GCM10009651_36430 [Microbacterium natoriense]|uniref:phage portal protein n=1 Tax=Microbacterium natoriense TaxID=284570 RepID=UPI0031DB311A